MEEISFSEFMNRKKVDGDSFLCAETYFDKDEI